jgi:hypothetical protein
MGLIDLPNELLALLTHHLGYADLKLLMPR